MGNKVKKFSFISVILSVICVVFVAEAAARGVKTIVGHYYPTAKNAMVREFYAQYGFAKTAEDADGNTEWTLDVAAYTPKHPHMKIER